MGFKPVRWFRKRLSVLIGSGIATPILHTLGLPTELIMSLLGLAGLYIPSQSLSDAAEAKAEGVRAAAGK